MKKKKLLQMNAKILKIHKDKTCAFCRTIAVLCIGPHRVNVWRRLFKLVELSLAVMK